MTYTEIVNRFVVEYQEDLSDAHKAEMRLNGIDPDHYWQLKWSFTTEEAARKQCKEDEEWYNAFCRDRGYTISKTFRVRDLGAPVEIQRLVMF
jgi:hypothetical protein